MGINPMSGLTDALKSAGTNSKTIAQAIVQVLKQGATNSKGKLKFGARQALTTALKDITNPSKKAKIVSAIGNALSKGLISAGSSAAEIATSIVTPIMAARTEEAKSAKETSQAAIAANERIQNAAIQAGVWNAGLVGTPDTVYQPGQQGTQANKGSGDGGGESIGSFLGG